MSIIRTVIANSFLPGFFDLSAFQNLHCDKKILYVYLFILFSYLIFVYLIDIVQPIREVLTSKDFRQILSQTL